MPATVEAGFPKHSGLTDWPGWDWSRDLREQDGWDEHARFMDSLVEEGFIVIRAGGP